MMQHLRNGLMGTTLVALALFTAFALPATARHQKSTDSAAQHTSDGFSSPAAAK
jgi:hypothetical protein